MLDSGFAKIAIVLALLIGGLYVQIGWELRRTEEEAVFMEPAVRRRGFKVLRTDDRSPPRGAIVWFEGPGRLQALRVSRVVGRAGDTVRLERGTLYVNGEEVKEGYTLGGRNRLHLASVRVPAGTVFVLNDARTSRRSARHDSRSLGPVPLVRVLGWTTDDAGEAAFIGREDPTADDEDAP